MWAEKGKDGGYGYRNKVVKETGGLTDIIDMLTVRRSIRSINTSPNTEVVYTSALNTSNEL